jgi:hypothetical protein
MLSRSADAAAARADAAMVEVRKAVGVRSRRCPRDCAAVTA